MHSFDNEALAVFLIYQGATHILTNHYKEAIDTLDMLEKMDGANEEIWQMYHYLKMIAYGRLCLFGNSSKCANEARFYFMNHKNYRRQALIDLFQTEFEFYENDKIAMPKYKQFVSLLKSHEQDLFYLLMAISRHEPLYYLEKISSESRYYGLSVLLKGLHSLSTPDSDLYNRAKKELERLYKESGPTALPYYLFLSYVKNKDWELLNDYIYRVIYPFVYSNQMIYFLSIICKEVGYHHANQKRYKDAFTELVERDDDIKGFQNRKKTTELRTFLSLSDEN